MRVPLLPYVVELSPCRPDDDSGDEYFSPEGPTMNDPEDEPNPKVEFMYEYAPGPPEPLGGRAGWRNRSHDKAEWISAKVHAWEKHRSDGSQLRTVIKLPKAITVTATGDCYHHPGCSVLPRGRSYRTYRECANCAHLLAEGP